MRPRPQRRLEDRLHTRHCAQLADDRHQLADRTRFVAEHPWLWRLGWSGWQVTAASDILLGLALVRTRWISRLPAWLALLTTLAGVVPDQTGQLLWTWNGVQVAQQALSTGDIAPYAALESHLFTMIAGFGPIGYLAGAFCWTWCFIAAGVCSRRLAWLATITWILFALGTAAVFLPDSLTRHPVMSKSASGANALAFVLLIAWLVGVSEAVFARGRPPSNPIADAPWRHPGRGLFPRFCNLIANSHLLRAIAHRIPSAAMASDIRDVVYINYLVDADTLQRIAPPALRIQRLGPDGRYAVFSFLTFRHGHFGPARFGRMRRLWPSPIQSNWRIHVVNPATSTRGIHFLSTAITSLPHALVTRLLTDGVPMHLPASADLQRKTDGTLHLTLDPGTGSAPEASARLVPVPEPALPAPWSRCFNSWRAVLEYIVPQDRAMCIEPATGLVLRQEIMLNIPIDDCFPVAGDVTSPTAARFAGDARPLCFHVAAVGFHFVGQKYGH
ncbi:MAG: hypothetical protein ACREJO_07225 [Phycisphaerales bacterium]